MRALGGGCVQFIGGWRIPLVHWGDIMIRLGEYHKHIKKLKPNISLYSKMFSTSCLLCHAFALS